MNTRKMMPFALKALLDKGVAKVSLSFEQTDKDEYNVNFKELNLLRSTQSNALSFKAIRDAKHATATINQLDEASILEAIEGIMTSLESAEPDPANDISPMQEARVWQIGPIEPDTDRIISRLEEFIAAMKDRYPQVEFDARLTHINQFAYYLNSNGVDYEQQTGGYHFMTIFTAKEGRKMSSMNYTFYSRADLDSELMAVNMSESLIQQITEQTETQSIPENFSGDVIFAPFEGYYILSDLIASHLGDSGFLTKSTRFPDHLGQKIFSEKLTVRNCPNDESLCNRGGFTQDGFPSADAPIIEKGVLKHYPIGLYTANKTGMTRSTGPCGNLVIEAGDVPLEEMIRSVKRGILCMRISSGSPNANGDFSGVIKNSYYIENGEILYPISETMLSANIIDLFSHIEAVSTEQFNHGSFKAPFIRISQVNISRK
ncbi:MAG: metallopeptidase TldD-related protein [Candidatus Cloacimonadaceae bacterium]|nr:metallopeptidase TldD-related protein [Candidatus Cloacimonadaceae bacterium]